MADRTSPEKYQRPEPVSAMVGKVLDPVFAKRGLSGAALIAAWPEIVGPRYAGWTLPERINWPRRAAEGDAPGGTLVLRVDGARAVYLQHELGQLMDRINTHLGFQAVTRVKIVQAPVPRPAPPTAQAERPLAADEAASLEQSLARIEDTGLKDALRRLGAAVLTTHPIGNSEETP